MRTHDPARRTVTTVRPILVVLCAALIAWVVLGVGLNRYPSAERPAFPALLFPTQPEEIRDEAMREIGVAAASGGAVPVSARRRMHELAQRAPLLPEPFLVEATIAATRGDSAAAERLYRVAEVRDPRSVLAHYALADRYLRTNRLAQGFGEMTLVALLLPGATTNSLIASLAEMARRPGSDAPLRSFFKRSPQLVAPVLAELVKDPAQADRAISLASGLRTSPGSDWWKVATINSLISNHEYVHAFAAWRKIARVAPFQGIYNPGFATLPAPPPFNWNALGGTAALVDPIASGGLMLIYYGREENDLVRQMLVLDPGHYQMSMMLSGIPAAADKRDDDVHLAWQLRCVDSGPSLGALALDGRKSGPVGLSFEVPLGCPAQILLLHGTPGSFDTPVELTLSALSIRREVVR